MASRSVPRSTRAMISRALLNVVETIAADFPDVPLPVVYDKVGDARAMSAKYLPDVAGYRDALECHALAEFEREYGRRVAVSR
jgi:hypothetical protein